MPFEIDILEDEIFSCRHEILDNLLVDRTTGENIIRATDGYVERAEEFTYGMSASLRG